MMMNDKWTYCNNFAAHKNIKLLGCTPETNYVLIIPQLKKEKIYQFPKNMVGILFATVQQTLH